MSIRVEFVGAAGDVQCVRTETDCTLMEAAVANQVPNILATCGGSCACGTCHVYVDEAWIGLLPPRGCDEESMLDYVADVRSNSRLSCQIRLNQALDGIRVTAPVHYG